MRREASVVSFALLAVVAVGCKFSKATDSQINPPPDPEDVPDGGGGPDLHPLDVITMMQPDVQLFEAEASQNCIEANPQTMNLPPDVLIVLDRSQSMLDKIDGSACSSTTPSGSGGTSGGSGGTTGMGGRTGGTGGRGGMMTGGTSIQGCPDSKWLQMTKALKDFLPAVETSVNWGLKFFGTGSGSCDVATGAEVGPTIMNAMAISTAINGTMPGSSTPTAKAITSAAAYLATLTDANPKFILLATDGLPTCGSGGSTSSDTDNAIAAVKAAKAMGFPTFVVGIGTSTGGGDATLTAMANEGGFPRAGTPAYYPVASASELKDAFGMISGMVNACYFSVTPVPKAVTDIVAVKGDGNVIPQDATDGWTFITMATSSGVQLNGKSCEDYKKGTIKSVLVDLPCIVP